MSNVQVIEKDGKPAFYVLSAALSEKVREAVEDAEDAAVYARAAAEDDGMRFPAAVVHAELDGAHPVRAWREYRGLTLQALADVAGLSKPYVSQIEGGKRAGTAATLKKLARALCKCRWTRCSPEQAGVAVGDPCSTLMRRRRTGYLSGFNRASHWPAVHPTAP